MFSDNADPPEDDNDEPQLPTAPVVAATPKITADQILTGDAPIDDKEEDKDKEVDPLASLTISDLLNHPQLGRAIQSWADTSGNSRLEAERGRVRTELESEYEFNQLHSEFDGMTQEEWQELVSEDRKAVDRLARYRALQKMREGNQNEAQIAASAETFALATQIATYSELLKDLDQEAQVKLDARNFQKRQDGSPAGRQGVVAWGKAIHEALVQKALDERWEAEKQNRLAKQEGRNGRQAPVLVEGQSRGAIRLTKEVLENMSMEEINKLPQEDVNKVLSSL